MVRGIVSPGWQSSEAIVQTRMQWLNAGSRPMLVMHMRPE